MFICDFTVDVIMQFKSIWEGLEQEERVTLTEVFTLPAEGFTDEQFKSNFKEMHLDGLGDTHMSLTDKLRKMLQSVGWS